MLTIQAARIMVSKGHRLEMKNLQGPSMRASRIGLRASKRLTRLVEPGTLITITVISTTRAVRTQPGTTAIFTEPVVKHSQRMVLRVDSKQAT